MSRRRTLLLALTTLVLVGVVMTLTRGAGEARYRFDAIFDNAKGVVPGQIVKVAGTRVGRVVDVTLTPERRARVQAEIDGSLAPFRRDARCQILPEALISEFYVSCVPGTPTGPALPADAKGRPTVRVERTAAPVSLQDLINIFTQPVNDRLRMIVNTLGIATAARGEDLNAIIRRANPTLEQVRTVLSTVATQRRVLGQSIADARRTIGTLARRERGVRSVVVNADRITRTTARRHRELEDTVVRLPGLLRAGNDALASLQVTTDAGQPLMASLRTAAPALLRVTSSVPSFVDRMVPALRASGAAATRARGTAAALDVPLKHFATMAPALLRGVETAAPLMRSFRDNGVFESSLRLFVGLAFVMGSYDVRGHFGIANLSVSARCIANPGVRGCDRRYTAEGHGTVPINDPDGPPQPVPSAFASDAGAARQRGQAPSSLAEPTPRGDEIDQARRLLRAVPPRFRP